MKYCSDCKKLYNGAEITCADCNKKYKDIVDINEPVLLCVVGSVERSLVCGALNDANIPFVEQQYGKLGVVNETVTGYDMKLLNIAVLVPYSAVPKAYEAITNVGVPVRFDDEILEAVKSDVEKYKLTLDEKEGDNMSAVKRTTVKVLSAIAFIILVALVVFGTDYVMELIMNLFGG